MSPVEETFVRTFVRRERRERILSQLASQKARAKFRRRLAHDFARDLDPRFVYDERLMPPTAIRLLNVLYRRFVAGNYAEVCHVISESEELDGQSLPLQEIRSRRRQNQGVVILLLPEQLAYYYTEDAEPDYVLLRSNITA